jgi:hypothetical protein
MFKDNKKRHISNTRFVFFLMCRLELFVSFFIVPGAYYTTKAIYFMDCVQMYILERLHLIVLNPTSTLK